MFGLLLAFSDYGISFRTAGKDYIIAVRCNIIIVESAKLSSLASSSFKRLQQELGS